MCPNRQTDCAFECETASDDHANPTYEGPHGRRSFLDGKCHDDGRLGRVNTAHCATLRNQPLMDFRFALQVREA